MNKLSKLEDVTKPVLTHVPLMLNIAISTMSTTVYKTVNAKVVSSSSKKEPKIPLQSCCMPTKTPKVLNTIKNTSNSEYNSILERRKKD